MIFIYDVCLLQCGYKVFHPVNISEFTREVVNLSPIVLLWFFQYWLQLSQLLRAEPNLHRDVIFNSVRSWRSYTTDNVPNHNCYCDFRLLVLCLLVLLFVLCLLCIELHVFVVMYTNFDVGCFVVMPVFIVFQFNE